MNKTEKKGNHLAVKMAIAMVLGLICGLAMLMLRENATVTVAHSRTKNLKELCKQADILIVAIGKPKFITEEYVKEVCSISSVSCLSMRCRSSSYR